MACATSGLTGSPLNTVLPSLRHNADQSLAGRVHLAAANSLFHKLLVKPAFGTFQRLQCSQTSTRSAQAPLDHVRKGQLAGVREAPRGTAQEGETSAREAKKWGGLSLRELLTNSLLAVYFAAVWFPVLRPFLVPGGPNGTSPLAYAPLVTAICSAIKDIVGPFLIANLVAMRIARGGRR